MKEFSIFILVLYFGVKILMGLQVLYNWQTKDYIETIELLKINKRQIYHGLIEHSILLLLSILTYTL